MRTATTTTTANFAYLYPELRALQVTVTPLAVYIISAVDEERWVVVHRRTYWGILPGGAERALRAIYWKTVEQVLGELERRTAAERRQGRRRWAQRETTPEHWGEKI